MTETIASAQTINRIFVIFLRSSIRRVRPPDSKYTKLKFRFVGFSKSALLWVHSYITGRSQCVISNSTTSESRETNLGVPQGSVLGPLLFSLYINDIKHLKCNRSAYLQIYTQVTLEQLIEGLAAITAAAEQISTWANSNCLSLNSNKTKAIIFGSSHAVKQLKALNLPGVSLGG